MLLNEQQVSRRSPAGLYGLLLVICIGVWAAIILLISGLWWTNSAYGQLVQGQEQVAPASSAGQAAFMVYAGYNGIPPRQAASFWQHTQGLYPRWNRIAEAAYRAHLNGGNAAYATYVQWAKEHYVNYTEDQIDAGWNRHVHASIIHDRWGRIAQAAINFYSYA